MSFYELIKFVHVITVTLSISGFLLRGIWMMQESSNVEERWVKVVPHINDTILLVSAIILSVLSTQYPITTDWINAKLIALFIYIVLGSIALKHGSTMTIRIISWCAAIIVFSYIIVVANVKQILLF